MCLRVHGVVFPAPPRAHSTSRSKGARLSHAVECSASDQLLAARPELNIALVAPAMGNGPEVDGDEMEPVQRFAADRRTWGEPIDRMHQTLRHLNHRPGEPAALRLGPQRQLGAGAGVVHIEQARPGALGARWCTTTSRSSPTVALGEHPEAVLVVASAAKAAGDSS